MQLECGFRRRTSPKIGPPYPFRLRVTVLEAPLAYSKALAAPFLAPQRALKSHRHPFVRAKRAFDGTRGSQNPCICKWLRASSSRCCGNLGRPSGIAQLVCAWICLLPLPLQALNSRIFRTWEAPAVDCQSWTTSPHLKDLGKSAAASCIEGLDCYDSRITCITHCVDTWACHCLLGLIQGLVGSHVKRGRGQALGSLGCAPRRPFV